MAGAGEPQGRWWLLPYTTRHDELQLEVEASTMIPERNSTRLESELSIGLVNKARPLIPIGTGRCKRESRLTSKFSLGLTQSGSSTATRVRKGSPTCMNLLGSREYKASMEPKITELASLASSSPASTGRFPFRPVDTIAISILKWRTLPRAPVQRQVETSLH